MAEREVENASTTEGLPVAPSMGPTLQAVHAPIATSVVDGRTVAVCTLAGALAIVAGDDSRSSARIVSGAQGEAFLILPDELRIRNADRSVADYEVTLAAVVRHVRVYAGTADDREIAVLDIEPGDRRVVRLGRAERRP